MDRLKDPAMVLSITNSIGIVGTTAYFYKQLESMKGDMIKITKTLESVLKKLSELEKGDQHKSEALHTLNDQVKDLNSQLEELPAIDAMEVDLTEVFEVLQENDIAISRPSLVPRTRKNTVSTRKPLPESDNKYNNSHRSNKRHPDKYRSDTNQKQPNNKEQRPQDSLIYEEDDENLISEIRRLQTTR